MAVTLEAVCWDENKYRYWITRESIQYHSVKNGEYRQTGKETNYAHYSLFLDSGRVCSQTALFIKEYKFWSRSRLNSDSSK